MTKYIICCLIFSLITANVLADSNFEQRCVLDLYQSGKGDLTLAELRAICGTIPPSHTDSEQVESAQDTDVLLGGISRRIVSERKTEFDPYVITPHKMNYILPAWISDEINRQAYRTLEGYEGNLEDIETKFQLSLKVPLNTGSMFIDGDGLYLGFTLEAWWQTYSSNISKPFRETNYQPELFYIAPLPWRFVGGNTGFVVGVEHQSNGRGQLLSRSWNRVYSHFLFEKENLALSFKPWQRLVEEAKASPLDTDGDDNPDIEDYLGHFELSMVYRWQDLEFSIRTRQNQRTHNGAMEVGLTFPLWGKLRGFATGFTGYGESLIDYNHKQTRMGIGVSLNNVL
ncbi:phospholipase A [Alteromonas ponticola]|uniref:Phospholipase A1 n=1 Tax=Alteromonas aquimaris TaxID=2998417 RepID=A0ABT3P395_9ALTE|nr:phospholipase A [Alteromonas aquimaris]MCW8107218.1 phospholipase A [Alteromonas aquimaris]